MAKGSAVPAVPAILAMLVTSSLGFVLRAGAQIPDRFTNLKVIDPTVPKVELVTTMRGIATALGVRCTYCHVGPDDLTGMDFATDEKPEKRTARQMLELVRAINGPLLADLPSREPGAAPQRVVCYTCHRGATTPPRSARELLSEVAERDGVAAALAEYRRLRAEHWGDGRYDLSARTLIGVGQRFVERAKVDDGLAVYRGGLEHFPDSADLYAAIGNASAQAGRFDEARAALTRALELDPEHAMARWGMSRLESAGNRPPGAR